LIEWLAGFYQGHLSGEFLIVKKLHSFIAIILSLIVVDAALALPSPTFRTVALMGQSAPGLPNDTSFSAFGTPSINSLGQVSFSGTLTGPPRDISTTNNTGIWTEGSGVLSLLVREDDPAVGGAPGEVHADFSGILPNLSNSGDTAWLSSVHQPGSLTFFPSIWKGNVGNIQLLASVGKPAPGFPAGVNFGPFNDAPVINAQGDVAYRVPLLGPGIDNTNQWTVWRSSGGTLQLLARQGDPAPGTSANFRSLWTIRLNDAGQAGISADLSTIDFGTTPESGLWLSDGSALNLVAKDHSPTVGVVPGTQFDLTQVTPFSLNSSGAVAFRALMRLSIPAGVDTTNDQGIWSSGAGSLQLVAREGFQAPGLPAGAKYSSFETPKLSNDGHTAFAGVLAIDPSLGINSSSNTGIWSDANGSLQLVARAGDQAPGMPMGAVFDSFFGGRSSVRFALNAPGHAAFISSVSGGGTTASNNLGLWAQDQNGNLRLVLRQGDMFEVAPGDVRLITGIGFPSPSAGGDGLARGFNDSHQLAVLLSFANNTSGVFVTSITVPEPGGLGLSLLAMAGFFTRCKQRR
jgi:hypothetical protein